MLIYRQGDVGLLKLQSLPGGLKKRAAKNRFVLAEGEVTGHSHTVEVEPEVELWYDDEGDLYLVTGKDVCLKHQEHAAIAVEPGIYRVIRQTEWDDILQEVRQVAD